MNSDFFDVLILGGGPAGLTASIYTSRANLKTLVIAGQPSGGQLMLTTDVENFPGFPDGIMGPQLIETFRKQTLRFNTEIVDENIVSVSGSNKEHYIVKTDSSNSYKGKTLIIATGASAKWLELPSEQRLRGKGVSACATCDGFFFKGKNVAVVGGGDTAMEEALFLTKFSPKVHALVRSSKDKMKASKYMYAKAVSNEKIEFHYNTEILEVLGSDFVEGLKVLNNITNENYVMEDVRGLFLAIGHKPNTEFLEGFVELGNLGYIQVSDNTKTSREGVFVAGDVSDYKYRQAVTAAGLGCMAALDAEKFLSEHEK
ncbi:thioredoxin-disulfide reductase [candidate division WWE3 bacterium RIFCSPHIGHO2_12_FULL_38_15]|uniref:Thioredoxin reductase n=1 Tax=candidate division WWE3 bacterium RIFCSPHIGHO2_02_FULL_38_14 TaxID=1802620 RepID=A0A1F4V844_UNCKA|nr:MAG: thioredoxin-disulfide reductase [candidate division WWE3 bacterium RIFCSPHIGHO2_01_FULL_38_45]OGC48480.1 MAG: thioredoxin-disulfide reductase [candidate division WWE3 bacterium RIFCSPHIGHO2_12_FULL_38_15]OGC53359.1 MAG: thioredoxin-disulfide reductase [candidate division WWE3 bacterium RIFCSPHIGHO2_02_FULL_38_14]OGC53829.1 MAG: thioredoxin-disulfide reductase [candidate division WWE3 bacterium RIFCSPLOWO2_01_FULL_37_24]HLB51873.1 thioredoxin-disulfide reductase [Patescibacteria group ba